MSDTVEALIQRLPHASDLPLPAYQTPHSAGMDLCAAVTEAVTLAPGDRALVPTGYCIALEAGYEAQVRPRSGLASSTASPSSMRRARWMPTIAARSACC